jgi:hypothetical protein
MTTSLAEGSRILGHGAIHLNSIVGGEECPPIYDHHLPTLDNFVFSRLGLHSPSKIPAIIRLPSIL